MEKKERMGGWEKGRWGEKEREKRKEKREKRKEKREKRKEKSFCTSTGCLTLEESE